MKIFFYWELAVSIEQSSSYELLREVVESLLEAFQSLAKFLNNTKKPKRPMSMGKKGTRKELHGKAT